LRFPARSYTYRFSASSTAGVSDDDPFSLDFTNYTPPPAPPPAPVAAPQPAAVAVPCYPQLTFPAALQEAAALYAAGKDLEATQRLENALRGKEPLGDCVRRVWHALFELLQGLGLQQGFETLALGYAQRFGVSPPSWHPPTTDAAATTTAGGSAQISLSGPLGARVADALKQVMTLAQKCQGVRIDLARLTEADNDGATLLLRALAALKKAKKEVVLGAPEHLASLLAPRLELDRRENESMWLLLLEMYQQAGRQEPFEETAVNYAVTFDVSPPSYEAPPAHRPAPEPEPAAAVEAAALPLSLSGQLLGKQPEDFAALAAAAQALGDGPVEIRADGLQRIDATSIEALKSVLAGINAAGRRVRIAGLAQLPAVFLAANGCDRLAELETRKI
jgi:ABC-type transporter Mla MlaB component